jgi:purine-nucleoside phosphorylase
MTTEPFALADQAAAAITEWTGADGHDVAVILGSGWSHAADRFGPADVELPVTDLPGFAEAGVAGHAGTVRSIRVESGHRLLIFLGRVHAYEGHDLATVVHGVRSAVRAGCTTVIVTNAAGGLRFGMRVGQPVLISDHINLTGRSPLLGPAPPAELGLQRFVDLTHAYSPRLRTMARQVDPSLEDGVYVGLNGPNYETPAEISMLRTLGADLVGMSTVYEVIAARQLGAEVLGISLVTNLAAGMTGLPLEHEEVLAAGREAAEQMGDLLSALVPRL